MHFVHGRMNATNERNDCAKGTQRPLTNQPYNAQLSLPTSRDGKRQHAKLTSGAHPCRPSRPYPPLHNRFTLTSSKRSITPFVYLDWNISLDEWPNNNLKLLPIPIFTSFWPATLRLGCQAYQQQHRYCSQGCLLYCYCYYYYSIGFLQSGTM